MFVDLCSPIADGSVVFCQQIERYFHDTLHKQKLHTTILNIAFGI